MSRPPDVAGLPWPEGDPGALKDGAAKARDVAAAVRQAGQRLSKAAPAGDDWKGKAASSFVSVVSDDGRDLEKAAASFTSVAGALSTLATVLDDAQDSVKRWARKLKDAEERAKRAEERAGDAATKLEAAQAKANPLLPLLGSFDPLAPFTSPAESAAYRTAQGEATEAKGDLTTIRTKAKDEAEDAVKKVEQADKDAADKIKAAAGKAPMGGIGGFIPGQPSIPRPDPGSGRWGSQPWYARLDDQAFLDVAKAAATAADALGYTNAARHLRHYLNNSGETLQVDPERMARDSPKFKGSVDQQLGEEVEDTIRSARKTGRLGEPVEFSSPWKGIYFEDRDWFLATGDIKHAVTGYVVVSPDDPSTAEVHYRSYVYDRYNWDGDKETKFGPVTVGDERMGGLQTAGLAREFDVRGSTAEQVETVRTDSEGRVRLGGHPVAGEDEGQRTDVGRDQQLGPSRVGSDGKPR